MKIMVFTKKDQDVPVVPSNSNLEFQHVRFESSKLDDLLLIAKFRIINFPTSIITDGKGKILLKVKGTIPNNYIDVLKAS